MKVVLCVVCFLTLAGLSIAAYVMRGPLLGWKEVVSYVRISPVPRRLIQIHHDGSNTDVAYQRFKKTHAMLVRSMFVLNRALRSADVAQLPLIQAQENPARWLEDQIHVEDPDDTQLLRISMYGKDTDQLAKILDAVVDAYFHNVVDHERGDQSRLLRDLTTARRRQSDDLRKKEVDYRELAQTVGGSETRVGALRQQLQLRTLQSLERRMATIEEHLLDLRFETRLQQRGASVQEAESPAVSAESQDAQMNVWSEMLNDLRQEYQESVDEMLQSESKSAELVSRKQELNQSRQFTAKLDELIETHKLNLSAPPRIQLLQSAGIDE